MWTYRERRELASSARTTERYQSEGKKYPVVQIVLPDAEAMQNGAGKRLPTEAEFEFAARGGLNRKNVRVGR